MKIFEKIFGTNSNDTFNSRENYFVQKEPYAKVNFTYQIFKNSNELKIIDHIYVKHTVRCKLSPEEKEILEKLKEDYHFYFKRKKRIYGYRVFRVEFRGTIFDIMSLRGSGYELYKPNSSNLSEDVVDGVHNGSLIDAVYGLKNYLSIIYAAAQEEHEKVFFGETNWQREYEFKLRDNRPSAIYWEGQPIIEAIWK